MKVSSLTGTIRRSFAIAAPYGRWKIVGVMGLVLASGFAQMAGVTLVFPFLALAADPERIHQSTFGLFLLRILPPMSHSQMLIWAGFISLIGIFGANAMALVSDVLRTRYAHSLGHSLRVRLVNALADRPYGYFLERNSAHLLQKLIGDVSQFISSLFLPLLETVSRFVTVSFLLVTVFVVQPWIALGAVVLVGGFYAGVFLFFRVRGARLSQAIRDANRGLMMTSQQLLGGIKPVMVHGKMRHFVLRFTEFSAAQARLLPRVPLFGVGPRYMIEPLVYGGLVAAVLWLFTHDRNLADILPNLSVVALAGYRMLPSIQILYAQLTQVITMQHTLSEIEVELAEASPDRAVATEVSADIPFLKAIRLEDVCFSYPKGQRRVLDSFSIEIAKNTSVGIVGTTGSGKSTLVDLILGLHQPQSGRILVDGLELTPARLPAWRSLIGYVPQDIFLLDASVEENIAFGIPPENIDRTALKDAARAAQILEFIEGLPEQWATCVGERGVRLSGGQRQRIGLARALYHRPQVLVLDEATSALDHHTEAEVMRAIETLHGRITMIVIAHRLTTLTGCDLLCRLEQGRGTIERVLPTSPST